MDRKSKIKAYIKAYEWSNIFAMIRNNRKDPKVCHDKCTGQLVVITGATSGIGRLTARKYASMGADLFCINRNPDKSEKLKKELEEEFGVSCNYHIADLGSLSDIHAACDELLRLDTPIDILIHNAGVYLTRKETTQDGIEMLFSVHYLSSFIINYRLMDKLKEQQRARIILVNSEGHRFAAWGIRPDDLNWEKRRYSGLKSYGSAKTAQLLSMLIFQEKFDNSGVRINAMHPGAVQSDTGQENGRLYKWFKKNIMDKTLKPTEVSAEALYYLGISPEIENISGKFFNLTTEEDPAPPALDMETARELWQKSLEMSGLTA